MVIVSTPLTNAKVGFFLMTCFVFALHNCQTIPIFGCSFKAILTTRFRFYNVAVNGVYFLLAMIRPSGELSIMLAYKKSRHHLKFLIDTN